MKKKEIIISIVLGITYGLFIRVISEVRPLSNIFEIISYAFLIVTPFTVGAISVYFVSNKTTISVKNQIKTSSSTMLLFLLSMFLFVLEGLVCIVLILPVFLIASMIGGLVMGYIINKYNSKATYTLNSFIILPLLLSPLESNITKVPDTSIVETSIIIKAQPLEIFNELATVKNINKNELGFSFMHFIGLPKPLEASMEGNGTGAIRTSKWEKGVTFKERITQWDSPWRLHYEFDIPKGSIPREALDRHVELGGDYFTVVEGGYDIAVIDSKTSKLTLSTRYKNKSHLKLYGKIWASFVFNDFHHSLLQLMKNRAEKQHNMALSLYQLKRAVK